MNMLFVTQGNYHRSFCLLEMALRRYSEIDRVGYYISDRACYRQTLTQLPATWEAEHHPVFEWDILARAQVATPPSDQAVAELETQYGDPTFWHAILADRRLYYGPKTTFTQDYAPRFSHQEVLRILQVAVQTIEEHFDKIQPDLVVSFICTTFGEYLYYMVAKKRGIRYLNLRNTKIGNLLTAAPDIFEPAKNVVAQYRAYESNPVPPNISQAAGQYLSSARSERVSYEGQTYLTARTKRSTKAVTELLASAIRGGNYLLRRLASGSDQADNQAADPLIQGWYTRVVKPIRVSSLNKVYGDRLVSPAQLSGLKYAFYPMHLEPEISLLLYSRPYLNQLEVIRWLSLALPVGWKLVVKDHPKGPGYRRLGYHRKLLQIPNVVLVPHDASSRTLIQQAQMIVTIMGFIGFEGLIAGKPVLALGHTGYECLPDSMYRRAADPCCLAETLHSLLIGHRQDDEALERYVSAVMVESVPFDWYTLGNVVRGTGFRAIANGEVSEYSHQIDSLAQYLVMRMR